MIPATEALQRLKDGNLRFKKDVQGKNTFTQLTRRSELVDKQNPYAVILGCADSRVPTEIIFDQGPGDLFVIRVAGNIVAPSLTGSVEYAATKLSARLVVVLGHSRCGAVRATLQELKNRTVIDSPNLTAIVERIRPHVESILDLDIDSDEILKRAVRANVHAAVKDLKENSEILQHLIKNDNLQIIGAEYALETGAVEFFET